ncbi:hypothetical protein CYMTET_36268 [Cymbomonas tetramitiformis]|uniref:L domain-like protein n=1 Tax=Cymbomonas tetramitiformis TaxID=36881 RepID=A0AAE0CII8_9CHLO|nr:hypothetical protein CYMTET_36268 [Cymbomonas tetramitiformis]
MSGGNFASNSLTGLIPALGSLTALTTMYMDRNSLNGTIPTEIGKLRSLRELWVQENCLTGAIPSEIGRLKALQVMWASGNRLDSVPSDVAEMASLRTM